MFSPSPRDLTLYDDEFDFETNGFCPHQWEVCVPQKNCILWSVVLSYLKSADFSVSGKFEERLNRLTRNVADADAAKSAILDFNPFFNIHKCFFDETLQKVCLSFKKLLSENRPSNHPRSKSVSQDMQMMSTMLKSKILIVDLSEKTLHLISPKNGYCAEVATITLFCKEYANKTGKNEIVTKRFTFGLSKNLCWELRKDALQIIFETSEIKDTVEKEIETLHKKKEKKVNLLIALLKKNLTLEVSELYDSPYTCTKLSDAGFDTEPRMCDAYGLSAFYYAMLCNDKNVIFQLHRYAVNNNYGSESSFRDPDPSTVSNLSQIQEIILEDRRMSQNFEMALGKAERARLLSEELQLLNEFLMKTCDGIVQIRKQPTTDPLEKASRLKRTMVHILEVYDEYFLFGKLDANVSESFELLENYIKHEVYYDYLDSIASLLFFDNAFLLKQVLTAPRSVSFMESKFVSSIMASKYFGSVMRDFMLESATSKRNENVGSGSERFYIFLLAARLRLSESAKVFYRFLKEPNEEMTLGCVSDFHGFLVVEDELLMDRLHNYLESALKSETILSEKFAIQRALHVVGESLAVENGQLSVIKHLLQSCLPSQTVSTLIQLKNTSSQLENHQFPFKFKIEQEDHLFQSIKSELREIKNAFKVAFDIQRFNLIHILLSQEVSVNFQSYKIGKLHLTDDSINDLKCALQLKISESFSKNKLLYETLWNKLVETTRSRLESVKILSSSLEENLEKIDDILCPLIGFGSILQNVKSKQENEWLDDFFKKKDEIFICRSLEDKLRKAKAFVCESKFSTGKSTKEETLLLDVSIPNIEKFQSALNYEFITEDIKKEIIKELPSIVRDRIDANNRLVKTLKDLRLEDLEERKNAFNNLFLDENERRSLQKECQEYLIMTRDTKWKQDDLLHSRLLQNLHLDQRAEKSLKKISELVRTGADPLQRIFEQKYVGSSQLQALCQAASFSENTRIQLSLLVELTKTYCKNSLENLLNRLEHLREISADKRPDISFLWERAKSSKAKQYLIHKIAQRYINEPNYRAGVEMLLCDCMCILEKSVSFDHYWRKTSNLFSGIDMRSIIKWHSHGDQLFHSIGEFLDPKDLPSALMGKMVLLLEDQECIEALADLWRKRKEITHPSDMKESKELKKRAVSSERWKDYCSLLAESSDELEYYDSFIAFLTQKPRK